MDFNSITITKGSEPIYIQLFNSLRQSILMNELLEGTKLPPIRELSKTLKINNITVINAYKLLEREGLLEKKIGSGSYVKCRNLRKEITKMDFTGRDSNIDSFPLEEINDSIMQTLKNDGLDTFKYEESQGFSGLQNSLVNYFDYYNIETRKEYIQIVSGGQQALDIISKALIDFGDTVITETPTYQGAINSFTSREARIVNISLEQDGIDLWELETKIQVRKPSFLYIMPFNQKPTGITYSRNKKINLLKLASKYNFYIIEDDLGSELSLGENSETLKSLDDNDRVIYIKSFSPLFMPGLRLGCIIPPESLFLKIQNIKETTDIATPGLIQRGFTHYLNKNRWKEYYQLTSLNIRKKREKTRDILLGDFKNIVTFIDSSQSHIFWIKLQKGSGKTLNELTKKMGVEIIPGETMGKEYSNYFMLNIKSIPLENIEAGLKILKESIETIYSI